MKKIFAILLCTALLLCACTAQPQQPADTLPDDSSQPGSTGQTAGDTAPLLDPDDLFSSRDYRTDYQNAAVIYLEGSTARCEDAAVAIRGSQITVTGEGTYLVTGTLTDGTLTVDCPKDEKVQLVLSDAHITSTTAAALYIVQTDKVFLTLAEGTENTLISESFSTAQEGVDGAVFSREDLTVNGSGSLTVESREGHGIVSKDSLTFTGGSLTVTAASHGLAGKDDVSIDGGSFTVRSGKDAIHAENNDDPELGYVYIRQGSFALTAEEDGISAASYLQLEGGSYQILTGGGSVNGTKASSDSWGGFGGGRPGGPGGFGGFGSTDTTGTQEDSTSMKGIKAGTGLQLRGGTFQMDCADDAIHCDGSILVSGGTVTAATGDDGLHAEENLTVTAGELTVTESYEGLEGLHILVSGGEITLTASDDGLNAAGGNDESGFGGRDGRFGGGRPGGMGGGPGNMGSGNGSITITGGNLAITASGDGIDANGTLEISGGFITVCGPIQGDTATLDYDRSAVITGGTFIGSGASTMAQSFSGGSQGVLAVSVGSAPAGSTITLADAQGKLLIQYSPALPFSVVILSCPEMVKGQSYLLTVGTASKEFTAQ